MGAVCYRAPGNPQGPLPVGEQGHTGDLVLAGADLRTVDMDARALVDKMEQLVSSYSTQAP